MKLINTVLAATLLTTLIVFRNARAEDSGTEVRIKLPSHFVKIDRDDRDDRDFGKSQDDVRRLRRRIRNLEDAVLQLQEEIYYIRYMNRTPQLPGPITKPAEQKQWACIANGKNETFLGKGSTKVEASVNAKQACTAKFDGFWCSVDESKCELAN